MKRIDEVGMMTLATLMKESDLLFSHLPFLKPEIQFSEFPPFKGSPSLLISLTFDGCTSALLLLALDCINSLIARIMKTTIGMTSPCRSQTSINLRVESAGSSSTIALYKVYITRLEVRATMIVA